MYQGMRPAEKYMVMMISRYQSLRSHISCLVTRYPRKAQPATVHRVPSTVRAMDTNAASMMPSILKTCT